MTKLPKPMHYDRHDTIYGREFKDKLNEIIDYLKDVDERVHTVENKVGIDHKEEK